MEAFVFGTLADVGCGVLAEEADGEAAQEREVGCALAVAQWVIVFAELHVQHTARPEPSAGCSRSASGCVGHDAELWK